MHCALFVFTQNNIKIDKEKGNSGLISEIIKSAALKSSTNKNDSVQKVDKI